MLKHLKLPFEVETIIPFHKPTESPEPSVEAWLLNIKKAAKENVKKESLRVAWQNRFKVPKYPSFEEYTPEEAAIEMWEQHFYENPQAIENQGIFKKINPATGHKFYETGDPIIDAMEKSFSEGVVPDLSQLNIEDGPSILTAPIFEDQNGDFIAVKKANSPDPNAQKQEKMSEASQFENYKTDSWLSGALEEDDELREMVSKLGALKDG